MSALGVALWELLQTWEPMPNLRWKLLLSLQCWLPRKEGTSDGSNVVSSCKYLRKSTYPDLKAVSQFLTTNNKTFWVKQSYLQVISGAQSHKFLSLALNHAFRKGTSISLVSIHLVSNIKFSLIPVFKLLRHYTLFLMYSFPILNKNFLLYFK